MSDGLFDDLGCTRDSIEDRIRRIDPKACTVELRPFLPTSIFDELAQYEFEPIRESLRAVFSHWLGEQSQ